MAARLPLLLVFLLVLGCMAVPRHPVLGLHDVLVDLGDGPVRFDRVVPDLPEPADGDLPLGLVLIADLPEGSSLAALDRNQDGMADPGEMTADWLQRAVRAQLEAPDGNGAPPRVVTVVTADGVPLPGVFLAERDRRVLRALLERDPEQARALEDRAKFLDAYRRYRYDRQALFLIWPVTR